MFLALSRVLELEQFVICFHEFFTRFGNSQARPTTFPAVIAVYQVGEAGPIVDGTTVEHPLSFARRFGVATDQVSPLVDTIGPIQLLDQPILGRLFRDGVMSKSEQIGTLSSPGDKEWILALVDDYDKDDAAGSEWPLDEFIRRIEEQLKSRFVNTQAVVYYQYNNSDSTVSVLQEQEQSFVMALTGRKPSSNGGNSSTSSTKQPSTSGGGAGGKSGARGKSRRGNASADGGKSASQQQVGNGHTTNFEIARMMSRRICVLLREAGLSTARIREVMRFVRQKDGRDEANKFFVLPRLSNDVSSGYSCLSPEEYRTASNLPGFSEFWASLKLSAKTLLDGNAVRIINDNDQNIDKFWAIMSSENVGRGSKQKRCYFLLRRVQRLLNGVLYISAQRPTRSPVLMVVNRLEVLDR